MGTMREIAATYRFVLLLLAGGSPSGGSCGNRGRGRAYQYFADNSVGLSPVNTRRPCGRHLPLGPGVEPFVVLDFESRTDAVHIRQTPLYYRGQRSSATEVDKDEEENQGDQSENHEGEVCR